MFNDNGTAQDQRLIYDGLQVDLNPAPTWRRFMAWAIDIALVTTPLIILGYILLIGWLVMLVAAVKSAGPAYRQQAAYAIIAAGIAFLLVLVLAADIYFIYFETRKGATIGKRLMALRVVSLDNRTLSVRQAVIRDLLRIVDIYMVVPGLVTVFLSNRKQRLGDMAAGTMVTYSRHADRATEFIYVTQDQYNYLLQSWEPAGIPLDDAKDFRKYAFKRFVLNDPRSAAEDEAWFNAVLPLIKNETEEARNRALTLRFFAEHFARVSKN